MRQSLENLIQNAIVLQYNVKTEQTVTASELKNKCEKGIEQFLSCIVYQ